MTDKSANEHLADQLGNRIGSQRMIRNLKDQGTQGSGMNYTPAQARDIAYCIPGYAYESERNALRSLAAQVEALTAENAGWEASQKENLSNQCELHAQINALNAERDALKNASNAWADLWYFVMDEDPMAFEQIVTGCPPRIWHSEAHKLMRVKYPKQEEPK